MGGGRNKNKITANRKNNFAHRKNLQQILNQELTKNVVSHYIITADILFGCVRERERLYIKIVPWKKQEAHGGSSGKTKNENRTSGRFYELAEIVLVVLDDCC